jgi:hypothetical protein
VNPDFRDLLSTFNAHGVDYLVVGAHALAAHGHVRATNDLDVWVRPSSTNAPKVIEALRAFGAPLLDLAEKDLAQPGVIFQIGVPPVRVDVITVVDGVAFDEAWSERMSTAYAGVPTSVLSLRHLILNKEASGRPQDLADLDWLRTRGAGKQRPQE